MTDSWVINNGTWTQTTSDGHSTPNGVAMGTVVQDWALMSTCASLSVGPWGPNSESVLYVADAAFKPLDAAEQQRMIFGVVLER